MDMGELVQISEAWEWAPLVAVMTVEILYNDRTPIVSCSMSNMEGPVPIKIAAALTAQPRGKGRRRHVKNGRPSRRDDSHRDVQRDKGTRLQCNLHRVSPRRDSISEGDADTPGDSNNLTLQLPH